MSVTPSLPKDVSPSLLNSIFFFVFSSILSVCCCCVYQKSVTYFPFSASVALQEVNLNEIEIVCLICALDSSGI